jgi:hypothetical protein
MYNTIRSRGPTVGTYALRGGLIGEGATVGTLTLGGPLSNRISAAEQRMAVKEEIEIYLSPMSQILQSSDVPL